MTVTITPKHNVEFCNDHGLIERTEEPCGCTTTGSPDLQCFVCKGTGIDVYEYYPYELNLSNANHSTLWHSLGLPYDEHSYCGEITADRLQAALDAWIGPELCVRDGRVEEGDDGPTVIDCGIHIAQATRYQTKLREIVAIAHERKVNIIWG